MPRSALSALLETIIGPSRSRRLFDRLEVPQRIAELKDDAGRLPRALLAQALNMMLFEDLLERVPESATYTEECLESGRKVFLDHGALRTVALDGMVLPSGHHAFGRFLEPLGYRLAGEYPLDALKMCGFVYCHEDFPEDISQFFVSELYPERFSDHFQMLVTRTLSSSKDPLDKVAGQLLDRLQSDGGLDLPAANALLPILFRCFDRQHEIPPFQDYLELKKESREMAWIATEGNAFNHATDRVENIQAVDKAQRELGRPMKPEIEVGQNARIRQTAYRATTVERKFKGSDGQMESHLVPGSFFEFIERGTVQTESGERRMDLRFDSRNAQGIFTMTRSPESE